MNIAAEGSFESLLSLYSCEITNNLGSLWNDAILDVSPADRGGEFFGECLVIGYEFCYGFIS